MTSGWSPTTLACSLTADSALPVLLLLIHAPAFFGKRMRGRSGEQR